MTNKEIRNITSESLRDWFKKEKWVRISSSGNIAGDCGTSKDKTNPDRCLPKAKAQSLTKGQRAATAAKKKKAGSKGKTVVKNTKKATVKAETKGAPAGHYFTKSGNLVKGTMSADAKERGARKSDPKDKTRSKVPKVTQYTEMELPSSTVSKINAKVKDPSTMAQAILHYINSVADNEAPSIFKNPKLRRALELLKDLGNDEPSNETADPQDGKAAPYGSGYQTTKEIKRPSIQGIKRKLRRSLTKEDLRNLVAGIIAEMQNENTITEKDDRCTRLAKSKYDTWPSAYASGAVVRCRQGKIWKKE